MRSLIPIKIYPFRMTKQISWSVVVLTMVPLVLVAHLTLLFSSRAQPTSNTTSHDTPYRVVLMSDTHVIGPQYVPGTESNPVDNESILKTPRRLKEVCVVGGFVVVCIVHHVLCIR